MILNYHMEEGQVFPYQSSGRRVQEIDLTGQSQVTEAETKLNFSVKSKGHEKKSYAWGNIGLSGERSLKASFNTIFPDLPAKPIKVGDTWTSRDDITSDEGGFKIHIFTESLDTLEGFETVGGLECLKITSKISGTLEGEGEQMATEFTMEGKIKKLKRIMLWGFVLFVLIIAFLFVVYRPWNLRWGATDAEVARVMAGDAIVDCPNFIATRAVTIKAGPEDIWPWIIQMGYKRGDSTAMIGLIMTKFQVPSVSFPSSKT